MQNPLINQPTLFPYIQALLCSDPAVSKNKPYVPVNMLRQSQACFCLYKNSQRELCSSLASSDARPILCMKFEADLLDWLLSC